METRREVPLVGRDSELGELRERLESAARGSREAILLEGEAGIGKSRLIAAAIVVALALGFTVYQASADESDQSRANGPLIAAFSDDDDDGPPHPRRLVDDHHRVPPGARR